MYNKNLGKSPKTDLKVINKRNSVLNVWDSKHKNMERVDFVMIRTTLKDLKKMVAEAESRAKSFAKDDLKRKKDGLKPIKVLLSHLSPDVTLVVKYK